MGLKYTGELLAVTTQRVEPRQGQTFEAFESTTLHVRDGQRVEELRVGRDFPLSRLNELRKAEGQHAECDISVFMSSGRLYAENVLDLRVPANS